MVRLLSLRLSRRCYREAILCRPRSDVCIHLRAACICRRLPGAPVRCARVRSPWRHDRPQIHLPGDHPDHGLGHLHRGLSAKLQLDRCRGANHPDRAAHAARPRARWRIRWRGDLRGRARAAGPSRSLHQLDSDHGNARSLPVADRDSADPRIHRQRVRRLGLAYSVPGLDLPARDLRVDPAVDERVARLPEDEGRGQSLQGSSCGIVRPVEEPEDRDPRAARPHRRSGRGVVLGPVLCAVLPDQPRQS